jgi:hypothetical protein
MTTNNFGATQPQTTAGGQQRLKCVYLNPQQNYEWATAACETNFSYVCQNKFQNASPTVTAFPTFAPEFQNASPTVTAFPTFAPDYSSESSSTTTATTTTTTKASSVVTTSSGSVATAKNGAVLGGPSTLILASLLVFCASALVARLH